MLTRVGTATRVWLDATIPWTPTYGAARSLLAIGTIITLAFNKASTLFGPSPGMPGLHRCSTGLAGFSLFCLVPRDSLDVARWLGIAGLIVVASGWRPRVTSLLHWWVSFSYFAAATIIDGGDQITAILTLLMLPITLTDKRKWHWESVAQSSLPADGSRLLASSAATVVRVQVAFLYFHAAVGKMATTEWANGTALYYYLSDPLFGVAGWTDRMVSGLLRTGLGVSAMTWGTILIELSLFLGLIAPRPWRPKLLILGIVFHTGIAAVMGLISFSVAMIGALFLYLGPWTPFFPVSERWLHLSQESSTEEAFITSEDKASVAA